ncbi:hypothetical protein ACIRQQ_02260 [Streptomyces fuscichromogenes]|uniref:hypothetical protein n=1 Tax=Streptomyces fuscichromogenes TaxID=1324013 RepID=UPI003811800D
MDDFFTMRAISWLTRHARKVTTAMLCVTEEDSPVQVMGRVLMGAAVAAVAAGVALGALVVHSGQGGTHDDRALSVIAEGAVCKSLPDRRYEVSCATTAFGDVRFNCTAGSLGRCPRTTAVTLRNVSHTPVTVTLVSGMREGDQRLSPAPELMPDHTVTLSPRHGEKYVFDILVRSMKPGVGAVKVLTVD